jgi:hypothetical protein
MFEDNARYLLKFGPLQVRVKDSRTGSPVYPIGYSGSTVCIYLGIYKDGQPVFRTSIDMHDVCVQVAYVD